ncbi:MAG TPA: VanZ family protein [Anaerolineales bacterium]|nr:VanZ family protein [Anaerolineales bacterium]
MLKWLTILFGLFILLIIILADTGNLGILSHVYRIPYADKAGHFILYGILALLINLTLFRSLPSQSRKRVAVVCGLILSLLIGLEEFSQQYFADRTFSLMDLGASYLGVISFSWLALRSRGRSSRSTPERS